jgi:hypothetical protein
MQYLCVALTCLLAVVPSVASAGSTVLNGSFEAGPPPFSQHDVDIASGSLDITHWLVTGNGGRRIFKAADVPVGRTCPMSQRPTREQV